MARDRSFWLTALAVAGVFVFAFFVRTYWNVEPATPGTGTPEGTFLLSESDAYFHRHSVERVQTEGWSHPIEEPLVNYPIGSINPNPPLMTWWIATWGALLSPAFEGDAGNHATACPATAQPSPATCVSTWWVALATPAFFGAVTALLVVLIGREVWGWRAGLLAGFFAATSTSHIERSVFGFADHDSFVLFFIVLSFYFFLRALHAARDGRWVEHWGTTASVRDGLSRYARANQLSLGLAALSGVALAGVGLSWKGAAYAAGIMLVYGVVQVLVNHWRRRDSTHVFSIVGVALLANLVLVLPYYGNPALQAVGDTMLPLAYITLAWIGMGILFTAARDLPFVLVLPLLAATGAIALVIAFFAAPNVAATLLGPLVYFKQTKLYTTIAEAHPADFNTVVFGTGVVGFFLAVAALPYLFWVNRKAWRPTWTFLAVWGLVAIFMTHSAVRFMFNATPVFALLAGWATALVVGRLRFETIGKNLAGLGGLSRDALRRAINGWQVLGAVLLALLLVLPNVILSVDAGMPAQYEDQLVRDELAARGLADTEENRQQLFVAQRFGAFGQGFITDYWRELFEWLATQDTQLPERDRPAFLSWWDYGHWALSLGRHPAVADNFQNGYHFAGNFIVAQNETSAVQLFVARILDPSRHGALDKAQALAALQQGGLDAAAAQQVYDALLPDTDPDLPACEPGGRPEGCAGYGFAPQLDLAQSVALLRAVEAATGERIRYFAQDVRLFPYDNPQTAHIDFSSIFYAPVTLSDHEADDYVEAVVRAQVPGERKTEFTEAEWLEIQRDFRRAAQINPQSVSTLFQYKEAFFNTMFYRAYLGSPPGLANLPATECAAPAIEFPTEGDRLPGVSLPAYCMEHFRLVYYDQSVRMVKYYPGAVVQGTVTVDGKPLAGARVVVFDDAGDQLFPATEPLLTDLFKTQFVAQHGRAIGPRDFDVPHATAVTGPDGTYRLVAPFSMTGQTTVRAYVDDAEIGSRNFTVTEQQAEEGFAFDAALGAIDASSGAVSGRAYFDADRDNAFGAGDQALPGAQVAVGDQTATAGEDGTFRIGGVAPGRHDVTVTADDHELSSRAPTSVAVRSGEDAPLDLAMALRKVGLTATVWRDADGDGSLGEGEGLSSLGVKALPDFRRASTALQENAFTRENGTLEVDVTPGAYIVRGETATPDGQGWAFGAFVDVARGSSEVALNQSATRLREATAATVNLTLERGPGNVTGAAAAEVLFIPTQGGLPAAERAPSNGTLTLQLVPGTYQVHAQARVDGERYALAEPLTLVVGAQPAFADGRLTKA